jgi:tRNA-specific 2-thiouridylase
VLNIEPVSGTVTVGPSQALDVREITAERPVWSGCTPPAEPRDCLVQIRAHGEVHHATVWPHAPGREPADDARRDRLRIQLDAPARAVAKGQTAVLYDGDLVLGSATIAATA